MSASPGQQDQQKALVQRLAVLHVLTQVCLVCIAAGYFSVQVVNGDFYHELAENNRLRRLAIEAPRGLIYDREGRLLVENVPSYKLFLDRSLSRDLGASLELATEVLERPQAELEATLAQHRRTPSFQPIPLREGLTLSQVARFGVQHLEHPEFEVVVEHLRLYRHAHQTAHLLGYLGEVTAADLKAGDGRYQPGDLIGRKGIEDLYEKDLRGKDGDRIVVVDSRGQQTEEYHSVPAKPGHNLRLTLDLELQQEAARLLEDKTGVIIAMDPRHGDILAMVSTPAFNPNLFARRLRREEWHQLLAHPDNPLQHRALQNMFPPGSLFKIVVALAGLDSGLVDPQTTVFCRGYSMLYNNRYRCWNPHGHGVVNLQQALTHSCNVYFHQLGQKLGIDTIASYARRFGLGRVTGIDLAGEKPGLVPDTRWSLERRRTAWYPGETISVATGQGPILTTPLQLAVMMAAVANGGHIVRPHLALAVEEPGTQRTIRNLEPDDPADSLGFAPEHLALVKKALWAVVNEPQGTGKTARIDGLDVAGKTGTAQVVAQKTWTKNDQLSPEHRDHAWFASFAPLNDPRLVIVVFVEHGGGGSATAAPMAKALYEKFFEADLTHHDPA